MKPKGTVVGRWSMEVDDTGVMYIEGDCMLWLAYMEFTVRQNDKWLLRYIEQCKATAAAGA